MNAPSKRLPYARGRESGQSLLEFAIIFVILILMVAGISEFGFLYTATHTLQNASREGARMAVTLTNLQANDPRVVARVRDYLPVTDVYSDFRTGITNNAIPSCSGADEVTVVISGDYQFVVLRLLGLTGLELSFPTTMRYQLCDE